MIDAPERFVCRPRGAELRLVECFADHRMARESTAGRAIAACASCPVGAEHAQLSPARSWPNGDRVLWIGEAPPELAVKRVYDRGGQKAGAVLAMHAPLYAGEVAAIRAVGLRPSNYHDERVCTSCGATYDARSPRSKRCDTCVPDRPAQFRAEHIRLRIVRGDQESPSTGASSTASVVPSSPFTPGEDARDVIRRSEPMATTYRYQGRDLAVRELFELPERVSGLSLAALSARLRKGWDPALAVTAPMGAPRGTGQPADPKPVPRKNAKKRAAPVAKAAQQSTALTVSCFAGDTRIASAVVSPERWAGIVAELVGEG